MPINLVTQDEIKAEQYAGERADYELEYAKLLLCKHDFDKDEVLNWIREHIYVSSKRSYLQGVYSQNQERAESNVSFRDEHIMSLCHERQLIFDAWKKQNKESAEMIKDMLNLMKHKMKPCNTERCQGEFENICRKAEAYLEHMNDDIDDIDFSNY